MLDMISAVPDTLHIKDPLPHPWAADLAFKKALPSLSYTGGGLSGINLDSIIYVVEVLRFPRTNPGVSSLQIAW